LKLLSWIKKASRRAVSTASGQRRIHRAAMSNELVEAYCIRNAMRTRPKMAYRVALRDWLGRAFLSATCEDQRDGNRHATPSCGIHNQTQGKSFSRATGEHVFPECNFTVDGISLRCEKDFGAWWNCVLE
jgi:hypothetical protein